LIAFLLNGKLPWSHVPYDVKNKKHYIKETKAKVSPEKICSGLPLEFTNYVKYARSLKFEEKPDYNYVRKLFRSLLIREAYDNDSLYDWVLLSYTPGRTFRRKKNRHEERKI
jgi:hypothetical protein